MFESLILRLKTIMACRLNDAKCGQLANGIMTNVLSSAHYEIHKPKIENE